MFDYTSLPFILLFLLTVVGLAGLYFGGDWLTSGSVGIAVAMNISKVVVGLTIVSMATSAPELVTSLLSGARGSPGLAIGNIIGSNIANICFIVGVGAVIWPFSVARRLAHYDTLFMVFVTFLFCIFCWNGLARWEGGTLLLVMAAYLYIVLRYSRSHPEVLDPDVDHEIEEAPHSIPVALALVVIGATLLILGANLVVDSGVEIARRLGVSDVLIGVTVVALGTSLPELAATVAAAMKKHMDIAAGNIVGSNLFNLLFIGGSLGVSFPPDIARELFHWEFPMLLLTAVMLWLFFYVGKNVSRTEGVILLLSYCVIIGLTCAWQFNLL